MSDPHPVDPSHTSSPGAEKPKPRELVLNPKFAKARETPWPQVDWRRHITIEPGKRGGQPCIRGLRFTVGDALELMAAGLSPEQIVAEHPDLTIEDIRAVLKFAAERERAITSISA